MSSLLPLDTRVYRSALRLYPERFRREFSPQMLGDFDEARDEAVSTGRRWALWRFRGRILSDFAHTLVLQWLRTGRPVIAVSAMFGTVAVVVSLVRVWPRTPVLSADQADTQLILLEVMVVVTFLVITATIIATLWSARLMRRRRRI